MSKLLENISRNIMFLLKPKTSKQTIYAVFTAIALAICVTAMILVAHAGSLETPALRQENPCALINSRPLSGVSSEDFAHSTSIDAERREIVTSREPHLDEAIHFLFRTDEGFRLLCLADFTFLFLLALFLLVTRRQEQGRTTLTIELKDKPDKRGRYSRDVNEELNWVSIKDINLDSKDDKED